MEIVTGHKCRMNRIFNKEYKDYQIKGDEMDKAYNIHRTCKKYIQMSGWKT